MEGSGPQAARRGRPRLPQFAGLDVRQGTFSVGLTWVSPSSFWVSPLAEVAYDFESNEWAFNYEIFVGKMFSSGLGLSVSYFDYELLDPASGAGLGKTGDRHLGVSLFYAF